MERNLYPVFDVNLHFTLWNTAILRHDSVSRPIKAFVNTGVWPSMLRFHATRPRSSETAAILDLTRHESPIAQ